MTLLTNNQNYAGCSFEEIRRRIRRIRELLYDQGFTISGARSQLQKVAGRARASSGESRSEPKAQTSEAAGVVLDRIRRGLNEILTILGKP